MFADFDESGFCFLEKFQEVSVSPWGGGGDPKKIPARVNAKKKNSCKEEDKGKKIHAEGKSNCDFYSIY